MAKINTFEDLEVWKKASELSIAIFELTQIGSFSKDYSLKDPINKTTGSIMDNIAEGFDRGGNREFIQFLSIAKGSAAEVRSQLYRALDRNHINPSEFELLKEKTVDVGKQLSGFMTYLSKSEMKGSKYVSEPSEDYG
ncbi:MAG: four helix bundle protein [Cyclobacteriaceae bacterium]|nr:four helix bundle protein [Cyclobacteriaceae bacterium]UYN85462.1 MAG: four helix bundle protein [Cyclobacteriaceae bacterium]